ncbi:MAG: hypothetical protein KY464_01690, partial [Gemmatimonadetes bacterium]|nr:hypothetical protein [Gemmatimonadota bacterium]
MNKPSWLEPAFWQESLRSLKAEVRAARTDRHKALVLGALLAVGLGSCSAGVAVAAWTRAC